MSGARKGISLSLRFRVLHRDRFSCVYCGAHGRDVELQVDHRTPVALGGTNDFDNLRTACFACNMGKRDMSIEADYLAASTDEPDDEYEVVGWEEAEWRVAMLAKCFSNNLSAELCLTAASQAVGIEGYASEKNVDRESASILEGMHAVGLIDRIYMHGGIFKTDAEGTHAHYRARPISPLEVANYFNRFGALRLSYWENARSFASAVDIHG